MNIKPRLSTLFVIMYQLYKFSLRKELQIIKLFSFEGVEECVSSIDKEIDIPDLNLSCIRKIKADQMNDFLFVYIFNV